MQSVRSESEAVQNAHYDMDYSNNNNNNNNNYGLYFSVFLRLISLFFSGILSEALELIPVFMLATDWLPRLPSYLVSDNKVKHSFMHMHLLAWKQR